MSDSSTCVIFDLDGTLIESEQTWRDVRHEFVLAQGGRWRSDAAATMIGMRTQEWARYIHDDLDVALPPAEIAKRVVDAVVARLQDVPVLPGADDALRRLGDVFRLGLATSAALPVAQAVLARTGWKQCFSVVVSADEVSRGKPAPDIYVRAVELLGANTSRTAAIEDSANGIRSAHAAGLAVIAIPNREFPPDHEALALASRVAKGLDELNSTFIRSVVAT
jgi:beta-phosphoglucomutase-like phosphatase (HAD superfamily)